MGGSAINAPSLSLVSTQSVSGPTKVFTKIKPLYDPLAYLLAPTPDACTKTNLSITSTPAGPLSPGTYCGGIRISGSSTKVTLNPGTYILLGPRNVKSGHWFSLTLGFFFLACASPGEPARIGLSIGERVGYVYDFGDN